MSPFEVFGGKNPLFEAYSTYLEANPLHEEVSFGIVGPLKGKAFSREDDKWHYGSCACIERLKEQNVPHGGHLELDICQRR